MFHFVHTIYLDTAAPKQNSGTFWFGGAPASITSQSTASSTDGFAFNATATTQQAAPAIGGMELYRFSGTIFL